MSASHCSIPLRRANASDAQAVQRCVCAAFAMYIERMGKEPAPILYDYARLIAEEQVWIAEHNDELAGVLLLRQVDGQFVLDTIASSPAARGQGVGRVLLQWAEKQALAQGYRSIHLYTHASMTENQQLYERIGYVAYRRAEQDGYTRIFYRKSLG